MSSNWSCEFEPWSEPLTVGQELKLHCQGDTREFNSSTLAFLFPENESYSLVWLRTSRWVEGEVGEADLIVTSYRPGEHKLAAVGLTDGQHRVAIDAGKIQVTSVISPDHPVTEPFGPLGPFVLNVPASVWLGILIVVAGVLGFILRLWYKRSRRRRWRRELEQSQEGHSPFTIFNKNWRRLNREYPWRNKPEPALRAQEFIRELSATFRMYLAQELRVPAHQWTRGPLLRELKREHLWFYKKLGAKVDSLWQELERAADPSRPLTELDCAQLMELCRAQVDEIWHAVQAHQSRHAAKEQR